MGTLLKEAANRDQIFVDSDVALILESDVSPHRFNPTFLARRTS